MAAFRILPYSGNNLAEALSNQFTTPTEVEAKSHFTYLTEYLSMEPGIGAQTILIEEEYVSKDYMVDYGAYYASCYKEYPKKCKRIHFFAHQFDADELQRVIAQDWKQEEEFWQNYLGFIVAKPIPIRVIGTTVLKTYPRNAASQRTYFGTRSYTVHLFGNEVKLDSLAFQEQDYVVSVCASMAIWSMLHKASCNSFALLKTPSEITNDADIVGIHGERMFPNKGLTINQIAKVIYRCGLVSEIITGKKTGEKLGNAHLKRIVEAYAPLGIPLILILHVPFLNAAQEIQYDYHAVTISGYKLGDYDSTKPHTQISWRSDRILKLFVHDDRWGPFCRLEFESADKRLVSNWSKEFPGRASTHLTDIIIPVHHKVRISFDDVELIVLGLDKTLAKIFEKAFNYDISWRITLNYSDRFKESVKTQYTNPQPILLKAMPRYIWIAEAYVGDILVFQLLFDATDLAIGMYGFAMYFYDASFKTQFHQMLEVNPEFQEFFFHPSKAEFYKFFLAQSL